MKSCGKVVLLSLLALSLFRGPSAWCITPIRDGDPGTIGWALTQKDGAAITLPGELVARVGASGKSFAIKEAYVRETTPERLICVSTSQLPINEGWCVTVTGTLRTFSSRTGGTQRVLVVRPSDVVVACSANNRPVLYLPYKMSGAEWGNMVSLSQLTAQTEGAITLQDAGLPPMPDLDAPEPSPPAPGSRDSLKWLPDGAQVSMNGAIVTAVFYGFFYAERQDRSFGIWVSSTEYVWQGELVDISGQLATGGGERCLIADSVVCADETNTYPLPLPIGLPNWAQGGGAVGPFTPAVGDSAGLNNTGLLVRTCGTVTHTIAYCTSGFHAVYLDDGSGVEADIDPYTTEQCVGVKVYIPDWSWPPDVDTHQTFTGVSAAETPEGASSSIRVLYATDDVVPSTTSGSGTINGTVTATGAEGKTVRVYCGTASTTAVFSGNGATYTLTVPAGDHAVTASVIGYKTATQLATVANSQQTTKDFALADISNAVEMMLSPTRVPPDGVSEITITAIAHDLEGRRLPNEPVSWDVDLGTVISSDATTDAVGEAQLVLQAPSEPGTANVSVTVGSMTVTHYAEFASATAPSVRILTPTLNETVSGVVTIDLHASDPGGYNPGIHQIAVVVDGQPLSAVAAGNPSVAWATYTLPNGTHTIRAAASDGDLEYGYSSAITVTTSNGIYNVAADNGMFDGNDPDPAKRTVTISANQDESTDWEIEIKKRGASSPTKVFTGTGTAISATWNGTDSQGNPAPPGQYGYTIRAGESEGMSTQSYGFSLWDYIVFLRTNPDAPTALLVEGNYFDNNHELFNIVEDACETRGFQVITIPEKYATWDRFEFFMNVYEPTVLYITTHGSYEIRTGTDCLPALLPQVSQFKLKDSWVYAYRPQDNQGQWYPQYPEPGQPAYANIPVEDENLWWPQMEAHYVSELGLTYYSPLRLVWMDSCMNGRIGSLYGDLSDQFNPYEVDIYGANDLASMFGIYDNAWTIGASFCGFFEISFADDRYRDFLGRIFGSMKVGYRLDQAITRDAWNERPRHTALYPEGIDMQYGPSNYTDPDEVENWCFNWRVPMPPYHNLRVHGNPWSTYLSP